MRWNLDPFEAELKLTVLTFDYIFTNESSVANPELPKLTPLWLPDTLYRKPKFVCLCSD